MAMSGVLVAIEVENTTDTKIVRAGRVFLPSSVRTVEVTNNGVVEIRACKGLVVRPSEGVETPEETPEDIEKIEEAESGKATESTARGRSKPKQ